MSIFIPRTDFERYMWLKDHAGLQLDYSRKNIPEGSLSEWDYVKQNRVLIDEVIRIELQRGGKSRDSKRS